MNVEEFTRQLLMARAQGDPVMEQELIKRYREQRIDRLSEGVTGGIRAFNQGLTLNFADEIEAGMRAPFEDRGYREIRDEIRNQQTEWDVEHPTSSFIGELAGGMTMGAGVRPALGALSGAAQKAIEPVTTWARQNPVKAMGAAGAVGGGVAGVGGAEEMSDAAGGGLVGGLVGGGLGLALGGLGKGLQGADRAQRGRLRDQIMSNKTPEQIADEMRARGQDAILGDVDHNTRGLLGGLLRRNDDASQAQEIRDFLDQRQVGQSGRIQDIITDQTGVRMSADEAEQTLREGRNRMAQGLYGPLRGQTFEPSDAMIDGLALPGNKQAAKRALDVLRHRTNNPALTQEDVIEDFDFWHLYQTGLRETGQSLANPNNPAASRQLSSELGDHRAQLQDEMFRAEPWGAQYEIATDAYREASSVIDALKDAETFRSTPLDALRRLVHGGHGVPGLSEEQKTAFTTGMVDGLMKKVLSSPDSANMARNLIKSPDMRERLKIVLGEREAKDLIDMLKGEVEKAATWQEVFSGSQTANRQAMEAVLGGAAGTNLADVGEALTSGDMSQAGRSILRSLPRREPKLSPKMQEYLYRLNRETDPAEVQRMLQESFAPRRSNVGPALLGGGLGLF
jgi:hypothetical protein